MLDANGAIGLADELHSKHLTEMEDLDTLRRYATGKQPMPLVVPSDAPREVHEMARISRINLIAIVIKALVESLYVDSFRAPDLPDNELPQLTPEQLAAGAVPADGADPLGEIWKAWQANKLDRGQGGLYRAVFTYGYGYVVVTPGAPYPVARPLSPRKMYAMYDDGEDYPEYALEKRRSGYRLYDSEGVYELRRNSEGRWEVAGEPAEHGLDYCPVIRYTSESDLDLDDEPMMMLGYGNSQRGVRNTTNIVAGEVAPLMTLQDQADFTTFALKGAEWYSAFRQRWVVGWTPESRAQKVAAGASQMWTFDEDPESVRIGEFGQTVLDGYLRSRQETLKYGATLSQTPVHELIGELVNLSAEALTAAEAGRDRKVLLGKTCLGESHEMLAQTLGDLMGIDIPDDTETIWRDTSARAFGAVVDGLGKLAQMLGIPPEALWDRIPGVSRTDIRRWKEMAQEGDALDRLTGLLDQQAAPPADPGALPGGETRTPSGLILPPGAAV
jgi:hypothetical protein